jgi:subtilase family serine protease
VQSQRPHSVPLTASHEFAATFYTPQDLENAYGVSSLAASGYNGKGESIAIIDAYGDPEIYQDLATFDSMFHLPAVNLSVIPVGPYEPSLGITYGWDSETALDVEAAHAMAPYAHINLVVAANASNALFDAVRIVVNQHLGDAVSMSWGQPENLYGGSGIFVPGFLNYPYADYYFSQGAAQGISFFSSTGDNGAFDLATTVSGSASFPATSPFVTAVGGTALFLTPKSGYFASLNSSSQYQGEVAWSVSPQYVGAQVSSGGGYSVFFHQPQYQSGVIGGTARTTPDVAADADPYTGFVLVLEGGTYVIGGTSLSSPLWAGMTAVLDQYVGRPLGLLNPYLYSVYGNSAAYSQAFHQVTFGYNAGYQAGPGYNLVTGLGSPNLPGLAAAIKSMTRGLSITVSTSQSSIGKLPQYAYGETFTISASVETPQGATVSTGSFTAELESAQSLVASVPLAYNGSSWIATYKIGSSDPPSTWTVDVSGQSGGSTGDGIFDISVGDSIGIFSPLPYPFAPPIPPGQSFLLAASATDPNGTVITTANLVAHLLYGGKVIEDVSLSLTPSGFYLGTTTLVAGDPQGTYTLVVNETGVGSAFEYLYFGEGIVGVILTPTDDAVPSASPGQSVTFLAQTLTSQVTGGFTSNVTANIYTLEGALVASTKLQPAPNKVQFGVYNFFRYQQANFTLPSSLAAGFYKVEFLSSYLGNATTGVQLGNFTTGFYVSGQPLQYRVSHPSAVFQGQYIKVLATVTDSTGAPVTTGVFFATVIPTGLTYEAFLGDFNGITGVPMQYSPAQGEWVGLFPIPSVLTSPSGLGNDLSFSAGPWTVFLTGESSTADALVPYYSYTNVLPYTYASFGQLTPSTVQSAPLVTFNGTAYSLDNAAANNLTISGLTINLEGDSIGALTVTNSTVHVSGSHLGTLSAVNSRLLITDGTDIGSLSLSSTAVVVRGSTYQHLSPALPTISVAGLSQPISASSNFTVTITGEQLVQGSISAAIDGSRTQLALTPSATGFVATGTINAASLNDGVHTLTVTAAQTDGFSANFSTSFGTNAQATALASQLSTVTGQLKQANANISSLSSQVRQVSASAGTLFNISYGVAAIAVIAVVVGVLALRRKPGVPAPS